MGFLSNALRVLARKMVTPPWALPDMEFQYGIWRGVSALESQAGRQLGEGNTRPFLFKKNIPAQTHICKYQGSRYGKLINISALRIAMQHFDEGVDIVLAVRAHHCKMMQLKHQSEPMGIWDIYIISQAAISIIAFNKRYKQTTKPTNIVSNALASQYQFITGIFMICREMIQLGDPQIQENKPIAAQALYEYADKHHIFASPDGMVCAGSEQKIKEFLELCINGRTQPLNTQYHEKDMHHYVADPKAWYQYVISAIDLDIFLEISVRQNDESTDADTNEKIENTNRIYQNLTDYCTIYSDVERNLERIHKSGDRFCDKDAHKNNNLEHVYDSKNCKRAPGDHFSLSKEILRRQNHLLTLLDRKPIKALAPKKLQQRLHS